MLHSVLQNQASPRHVSLSWLFCGFQVDYQHNISIITEGEIGDKFYIIKEGSVNVTKGQSVIDKLGPGDYFGERALIRDDQRAATVVTEGYVVCYTLNRESFNNLLGPIETLWRYEVLKKVQQAACCYNTCD